MAGLVFRISLPRVGSKLTHQIASAHGCGTNCRPGPSSEAVSVSVRSKTIIDSCRFALGHLARQRLVLLYRERHPVEWIAVADLVWPKSLLQQVLHKFAPLPRGDGPLEPPNQILWEVQQELLCVHDSPKFEGLDITINLVYRGKPTMQWTRP
jgi:hypothetical protein